MPRLHLPVAKVNGNCGEKWPNCAPHVRGDAVTRVFSMFTTSENRGFRVPDSNAPFWRRKAMSEMTRAEWESLCDGCGRCCLNKLIDEDTNETVFTDVGCTLLDGETCRCKDYKNRQAKVPDCVRLTWRNVKRLSWLPPTCGYRLVANGQDLPWWHP